MKPKQWDTETISPTDADRNTAKAARRVWSKPEVRASAHFETQALACTMVRTLPPPFCNASSAS